MMRQNIINIQFERDISERAHDNIPYLMCIFITASCWESSSRCVNSNETNDFFSKHNYNFVRYGRDSARKHGIA